VAFEKAFAINAPPDAIWRALTGELQIADTSTFEIERAIPNRELSLWVDLQGGVRASLTYKLLPREGHTEVVASMTPMGFRYLIQKMITLGRADTNYQIALVQGLSNLKEAAEETA
jgi:hypothetical protein